MEMVERLPPQSREAERCVLGSMLRDNAVIGDVLQVIGLDNFYVDAHQKIFQGIRTLYDAAQPVDLVVLAEWMTAQKTEIQTTLLPLWPRLRCNTASNLSQYSEFFRLAVL